MPITGPPSFAALIERSRSQNEIVFAESKGKYVGGFIVAVIIASVLGGLSWKIDSFARELFGAEFGRTLAIPLAATASVGGFLLWRRFGLHRRKELHIYPASMSLLLLIHRLIGAADSQQVDAPGMQRILLLEEPWFGSKDRTVWNLGIQLHGGAMVWLDHCANKDLLMPLGQTLTAVLSVPLEATSARQSRQTRQE